MVMSLLPYLSLTDFGLAELHLYPDDASGHRVGFFDNADMLAATISDYADRGRLMLGLHPRDRTLLDRAPNRLRAGATPARPSEVAAFCTAAIQVHHPDDGECDSTSIAHRIIQPAPTKPMCVQLSTGPCMLLFAVPEIELRDRADLEDQLIRYAREIEICVGDAHTQIQALSALDVMIPLTGTSVVFNTTRVEFPKLGRRLHRRIPQAVVEMLNKHPSGQLAKMFKGKSPLGVDDTGTPIDASPEAYDLAFAKQLIRQNRQLTREDLADALWNRPDNSARESGTIDTAYDIVDRALDAVPAPAAKAKRRTGGAVTVVYPPEIPLRDRLETDYYRYSDKVEDKVARVGVPITEKAKKVIDYLLQQNAEFYFFEATNEVVFVIEHKQHTVSKHNHIYSRWFTSHVGLFTVNSRDGGELTAALRDMIHDHEQTIRADRSRWGDFKRDGDPPTLYFCFDPNHIQMLRVRPAIDGKPQVDVLSNGDDGVTLRGPIGRRRALVYEPGAAEQGFAFFQKHVHDGQALEPLDKLMSTAFNMAALIPDLRQRPIKMHRGAPGSGKTYAAYDWEITIYGMQYSSSYSDRASLLKALKSAGPFITQDNAEADVRRKYANEYLVAATGSRTTERELYTNNEHVVYEPNGSLCLTAVEGMSKPEEIRRVFEFAYDDYYHNNEREDPTTRAQRMERHADHMLSAILDMISLRVLPDWRQRYADCVRYVTRDCPRTSKKAFNDYLAWMLLFVESFGEQLCGREIDARTLFHDYMGRLASTEIAARVTGDPALSCLDALRNEVVHALTREPDYATEIKQAYFYDIHAERLPNGQINIGPFTTSMLMRCFSRVSKQHGLKLPYADGRVLGHRMSALSKDPAFNAVGWERRKLSGRAHRNNNKYVLTWHPPEVSIDPPGMEDE